MNDHAFRVGARGWLGPHNGAALLSWFALTVSGCSGDADGSTDNENIASTQAELFELCQGVPADQTFEGRIDPPWITPNAYDICGGNYVVDIEGLYSGAKGVTHAVIEVHWAEPITTQKVCEAATISGTNWCYWQGGTTVSTSGRWVNGRCELELGNMAPADSSCRVVAAAALAGRQKRFAVSTSPW